MADACCAHKKEDRLEWVKPYLKPYDTCPLCSGKNWASLYELGVLKVYKCRDCSMMFLNPCLMPEEQKMIFSSKEFLTKVSGFFADYHDDSSWTTPKTSAAYASALEAAEAIVPSRGKWLDVGCGKGSFLTIAKSRGWQAYGLEPNFDTARRLKESHSIEVYTEDFFEAALPASSFDAVSLWDLIEHTPDPARWMKRCLQLLKPGGLLVIATPNHFSFLDMIVDISYRLSGGKFLTAIGKLYTVDHTLYLTDVTLKSLYERSGFDYIRHLKVNTDLSRYSMNPLFRLFSETLLGISSVLGLQNRVIMIGRKPR